jgi:hypothetical protein
MLRRFRSLTAAFAAAALIVGLTGPASADKLDNVDSGSVPWAVDLILMRPIGLVATAVGAVAFVPAGAITAAFHRESVPKVFNNLVRGPYAFTFEDPLGTHPEDRSY